MVKRVVTEAVGKTVIRLKPPHARRLDSVIEAEQRAKAERPLRGYLTTAPVEEEEAIAVERDLVFNEWRNPFLKALAKSGNITAAARSVGTTRKRVEDYMGKSASFQAEIKEAIEEAGDLLEAVALDRARKGSDFLLWRLLQGAKPEKYGNKSVVTHKFSDDDRKRVYAQAKDEGLTHDEATEAVEEVERMIRAQASKAGR